MPSNALAATIWTPSTVLPRDGRAPITQVLVGPNSRGGLVNTWDSGGESDQSFLLADGLKLRNYFGYNLRDVMGTLDPSIGADPQGCGLHYFHAIGSVHARVIKTFFGQPALIDQPAPVRLVSNQLYPYLNRGALG